MYQEYHTGHAWGSRDDYDLCMDTGKIGVETAAGADRSLLSEEDGRKRECLKAKEKEFY